MPASRMSHSKSRNGCVDCKRRKVKCDETRPGCTNCRRRGNPCVYTNARAAEESRRTSQQLAPSLGHTPASPRGPFGTPSANGDAPRMTGLDYGFLNLSILSGPLGAGTHAHGETWRRDLELMHHYATSTCTSLSAHHDMQHVWRVVIPAEAYRHTYVMHGLLAVAALHKASLSPHYRETFADLSAFHQTLGLKGFVPSLPAVDRCNWAPVFCFSSMVILYVCSLPQRCPDQYLAAPVDSVLELFASVRGIQSVFQPFLHRVGTSRFGPLIQGMWLAPEEEESGFPEHETILPRDTSGALLHLSSFFQARRQEEDDDRYEAAAGRLYFMAKIMAHAGVHIECGMLLVWPYTIPETVLMDLKARKPEALVLLAYFCVFLQIVERRFWYLSGWSRRLFADLEAHLETYGELQHLMLWPRKHLLNEA